MVHLNNSGSLKKSFFNWSLNQSSVKRISSTAQDWLKLLCGFTRLTVIYSLIFLSIYLSCSIAASISSAFLTLQYLVYCLVKIIRSVSAISVFRRCSDFSPPGFYFGFCFSSAFVHFLTYQCAELKSKFYLPAKQSLASCFFLVQCILLFLIQNPKSAFLFLIQCKIEKYFLLKTIECTTFFSWKSKC